MWTASVSRMVDIGSTVLGGPAVNPVKPIKISRFLFQRLINTSITNFTRKDLSQLLWGRHHS